MKPYRLLAIAQIIIINLVSFYSRAQFEPDWVYCVNAYGAADLADMEVDTNGNTYVAVNYDGALTLPLLKKKMPYSEYQHIALIRLDKKGEPTWAHSIESAYDCRVKDMVLAPDGDILITGFSDGVTVFASHGDTIKVGRTKEPEEFHQPRYVYIARYSPEGRLRWVKSYNEAWGQGLSIAVNSRNEIYWTFYYRGWLKDGETVVDELSANNKNADIVLLEKLDSSGQTIRRKHIDQHTQEGYPIQSPRVLVSRKDDGVILCGSFWKHMRLSAQDSLSNDGYYDGVDSYIARYDKNDSLIWCYQIGGQSNQFIKEIQLDGDDNLYFTGEYGFECVISRGISMQQRSKFEMKSTYSLFYGMLDPSGQLSFTHYHNNPGNGNYVMGRSIALDEKGYAYVGGIFNDTLQFDGHHQLLMASHDHNYNFTMMLAGDSLMQVQRDNNGPGGTGGYQCVRVGGDLLVKAGNYYGNNSITTTKGTRELPDRDHGRATYITGTRIPSLPDHKPDEINDQLTSIRDMLTCIDPDSVEAENLWLLFNNIETMENLTTPYEEVPCGFKLQDIEATLSPNPTRRMTTLTLSGIQGIVGISILSEGGQYLFDQEVEIYTSPEMFEFDIQSAANGLYFVVVKWNGLHRVIRLVKTD